MRRTAVVASLALLLVSATVPAAGAGGVSAFAPQEVDPDSVSIDVDVQADGDAAWRIEYRVRLATENETEAFRALMADVEHNSSAYLDRFRQRITDTVAVAENATGRSMRATNFSVRASVQTIGQEYGILVYEFTWVDFAAVRENRRDVGDAIAGFYLDSETSLRISWPANYDLASVTPEPTSRSENAVTWQGAYDFAESQPSLVLAPPDTGLPLVLLVAVGLVLALGAVGVRWWRRRGGPVSETGGTAEAGAERPAEAAASAEPEAGAATGPPEELLSNEEQVLRVLREHGGRVKQQTVVEELGWTDAKTSQVVSDLRDEGGIESFRLGRENVLRIPEESGEE